MAGVLSGATLRTWCTLCAFAVAVVVLGWMYTEQHAVQRCMAAHNVQRDASTPQQHAPPIHLVVQLPKENKTTKHDGTKWDYNWDKRAWANPQEGQNVPTRTLILVRHGQYDMATGHLTELGQKQANLTGLRLAQMNLPYDIIYHSTLDRAIETAKLVNSHLSVTRMTSDDVLQEGGPVPPEPTVLYWGLPDVAYHTDGPRMEAAFRKYVYRADKQQQKQSYEIIVGHGNIFRFIVLRALQFPPEAWMRVFIAHASITVLHINADGTVNMNKFGDSGHFPSQWVTY